MVRLHRSVHFFRVDNKLPFTFDYRIVRYLEKAALLRADGVTSPTQFMLDSTFSDWLKKDRRRFTERTPTAVIANGIELPAHSSPSENSKQYICFVGRLEPAKGVHTLIYAFQSIRDRFPNLALYLLGADSKCFVQDGTKYQLMDYLKKNPSLANNVTLVGKVDDVDALYSYVAGAVICVAPSEGFENMPYSILEAMALGKAIVVSNTGGLPEIIEDQKTGLVHRAGDINDLAQKIKDMIYNDALRTTLSSGAHQACSTRFSIETTTAETSAFYQHLLSR